MKIVWTEPALCDLEDIRDYIRKTRSFMHGVLLRRSLRLLRGLRDFRVSADQFPRPMMKISVN